MATLMPPMISITAGNTSSRAMRFRVVNPPSEIAKKPRSGRLMPPTRVDRNLFRAEAPLPTTPASSAPLLTGQRARRPKAASSLDLGYRVLGGLGEVELRLPDE